MGGADRTGGNGAPTRVRPSRLDDPSDFHFSILPPNNHTLTLHHAPFYCNLWASSVRCQIGIDAGHGVVLGKVDLAGQSFLKATLSVLPGPVFSTLSHFFLGLLRDEILGVIALADLPTASD